MLMDVYHQMEYVAQLMEINSQVQLLANGTKFRKIINLKYFRTEECVATLGGSFIEFDIHS